MMKTYLVVSRDGRTTHVSAYTRSDAFQQADSFCGQDGIKEFREV